MGWSCANRKPVTQAVRCYMAKDGLYLVRCYQIVCAICDAGEYHAQSDLTRSKAIRVFEKYGWRKARKHGWLCPKCAPNNACTWIAVGADKPALAALVKTAVSPLSEIIMRCKLCRSKDYSVIVFTHHRKPRKWSSSGDATPKFCPFCGGGLTKHAPDVAKASSQKGVLRKNRSGKRAGVA